MVKIFNITKNSLRKNTKSPSRFEEILKKASKNIKKIIPIKINN